MSTANAANKRERNRAKRARNNILLNTALRAGTQAGMSELEIFERLVHGLLDLHDESFQEKLDQAMNSKTPIGFNNIS